MKKIGKINLLSLEKKQFTKEELIYLKGGYTDECCGCGCVNDMHANRDANLLMGYSSSIGGGALVCYDVNTNDPDWYYFTYQCV